MVKKTKEDTHASRTKTKKKEEELRVKAQASFVKQRDDESMPRLEAIMEELSLDPADRMDPMQADTYLPCHTGSSE